MRVPCLHHNGERCPGCALRREADQWAGHLDCQTCDGFGWLQKPDAKIVAETVATARAHYWPAREAAFAEHNRRMQCPATP
ncbi:MAG: hypothetical protein KDK24_10070 [Pseudooceanicola sp.]|nr:hypothetical protein [Pseudooceanicola sp.]